MIVTVLRPVDVGEVIGACSPHEHLVRNAPETTSSQSSGIVGSCVGDVAITLANLAEVRSDPDRFPAAHLLSSVDECVQELEELKASGGSIVLECTTVRNGRHPTGLTEIASRTGMLVVMGASCMVSLVQVAVYEKNIARQGTTGICDMNYTTWLVRVPLPAKWILQ